MLELQFPELRQTYEYDCGAKSLQAILAYYGIKMREELIINYAKTNEEEGTSIGGILSTLKMADLEFDSKSMSIADLHYYADKKIPVMLLLQAWDGNKNVNYEGNYSDGHWVVMIGYDKDKIIFEDPYCFERDFLTNDELLKRWHGGEEGKKIINHGIAIYGKMPSYEPEKMIHMD